MRKIIISILLLILFIIPTIVNAQSKYEIKEIKMIGQEGSAIEKEPASFSNGKLNINVKLTAPKDSIKYQIKISNISNVQYLMNIDTQNLSNEYIKYTVEYENNTPKINPKETKTIQLSIKMENDVPLERLINNNGIYTDKKTINISLTNDNEIKQNPKTLNNTIIILSLILLLVILLVLIIKYEKMRSILSIFLIIYLLIPPHTIAIEKVDLIIESEVEINKQATYTIRSYNYNVSPHTYTEYTFPYISGMTGQDYLSLNSDGHLPGFYIPQGTCAGFNYVSFEYEECMEEADDPQQCTDINPYINYDFYTAAIVNSQTGYYVYFTCCLSGDALVETKNKKTKKRKKKKLKDLTYDDLVLVWDFDKGCLTWAEIFWMQEPETVPFYYELTFDDGTKLEVIGDHKIYNSDLDRLVNCIEGKHFEVGTHTINDKNEVLTLVSKERIDKVICAYNVITKNHINVFANGILTSWNINNLYEIENKKFNKNDNVEKVTLDKDKIPEDYDKYLRLSEIPADLYGTEKKTQEKIYELVTKLENNKKNKI